MTPEPFNPVKQPDQGILKVRAASMSKVKRVKSKKLDKKSKTQTPKRSLASDFFWTTVNYYNLNMAAVC